MMNLLLYLVKKKL